MSAREILAPEQKVAILREHLIQKVPVSQVCDKHGVSIVNFNNWQKQRHALNMGTLKPDASSQRRACVSTCRGTQLLHKRPDLSESPKGFCRNTRAGREALLFDGH